MNSTINIAKTWQMILFVFNNTATNTFFVLMLYISYYAVGVAGLGVVGVSFLLTSMRIFDGITDPIIGYFIDKLDTKFGKFRPSMLIGYTIMTIVTFILFYTVHTVPVSFRFIYFTVLYGLYIIGYTFQTACTKAGQSCLTCCPIQRPTFALYDGLYNTALFAFTPLYILNYLVPKYTTDTLNGLNNAALHQELHLTAVILAGIFTVLAIIGIAEKDKKEFFGLGKKTTKVEFKDYIEILKNNKAIQMLIFAASTDKLAATTMSNATVGIIIFAIITGNPYLQGEIAIYTTIPILLILIIGIRYASRFGQKTALVGSTWLSLILCFILAGIILFGPMNTVSFSNMNTFTILFVSTYILLLGVMKIAGSIVIPMIPDCADYETYRTGRYIPGMMGTLFSFIDKLVSSFATTIVGFTLAYIGFTQNLPTPQTPLTSEILYMGVALFLGMPIVGFICSLIAMKNYPLTREKMVTIQEEIQKIKASA